MILVFQCELCIHPGSLSHHHLNSPPLFCDYRLPLRLLLVFSKEREMLESRGRLMIRELCRHLDPRRLYVTVARAIQQDEGGGVLRLFSWEDFSGMIWGSI